MNKNQSNLITSEEQTMTKDVNDWNTTKHPWTIRRGGGVPGTSEFYYPDCTCNGDAGRVVTDLALFSPTKRVAWELLLKFPEDELPGEENESTAGYRQLSVIAAQLECGMKRAARLVRRLADARRYADFEDRSERLKRYLAEGGSDPEAYAKSLGISFSRWSRSQAGA